MPSKSHIAFALVRHHVRTSQGVICYDALRFGVDLIQKATAITLVENARETPWLTLEGLHVLDLDEKYVTGFRGFDFERPGEIMNPGKIDIFYIVCTIIVSNLAARPVDTLNLHNFIILDRATGRNCAFVS